MEPTENNSICTMSARGERMPKVCCFSPSIPLPIRHFVSSFVIINVYRFRLWTITNIKVPSAPNCCCLCLLAAAPMILNRRTNTSARTHIQKQQPTGINLKCVHKQQRVQPTSQPIHSQSQYSLQQLRNTVARNQLLIAITRLLFERIKRIYNIYTYIQPGITVGKKSCH